MFFDAVLDDKMQPIFNGTADETKKWLRAHPDAHIHSVCVGSTMRLVSVKDYLKPVPNKKPDHETYTSWRVHSRWHEPSYYVYSKKEAEKLEKDPNVQIDGPIEQWAWIRNRGLGPEWARKFEFWAKKQGIAPYMHERTDEESRRAMIMQWWDETNGGRTE